MNDIKEFFGRFGTGEVLYEKLREEYVDFFEAHDHDKYGWFHVMYLKRGEDIIILWFSVLKRNAGIKPSFVKILKVIDCTDFGQVLILLTLFPLDKKMLKKILKSPEIARGPLDRLLASTHGWILYRQQLEMILQLSMKVNATEAIQLRKDYNARKADVIDTFGNYKLFGESLSDVIRNRCIAIKVSDPLYWVDKAFLITRLYNQCIDGENV